MIALKRNNRSFLNNLRCLEKFAEQIQRFKTLCSKKYKKKTENVNNRDLRGSSALLLKFAWIEYLTKACGMYFRVSPKEVRR